MVFPHYYYRARHANCCQLIQKTQSYILHQCRQQRGATLGSLELCKPRVSSGASVHINQLPRVSSISLFSLRETNRGMENLTEIPLEEADLSALLKNLQKLACCMALILTYCFSSEVCRPQYPERIGRRQHCGLDCKYYMNIQINIMLPTR